MARGMCYLANACLRNGGYDKAVGDFTEAIRIDPKNARAFHGRGVAWYYLADHAKAIADCTEAIRLDPKAIDPYKVRGEAYLKTGERKEAEADFLRAQTTRGRGAIRRGAAIGE